mgnify:FL=1
MGTENIHLREKELIETTFRRFRQIDALHILAGEITERLGVFSFYIDNIHHNLVTRLLNDRYGIQVRGGCSCAGTYGHFLLDVDIKMSKEITDRIEAGDLSLKPGWVRLSLHPTMTDKELDYILDAIADIAENAKEWSKDYVYDRHTNEFRHKDIPSYFHSDVMKWYDIE